MVVRAVVAGLSLATLTLVGLAPAQAAQQPGPARAKGHMKVGGSFKDPSLGLEFTYSASVVGVKGLWYNSGDAHGFRMAKKKPYGTLKMTYVQRLPGLGCELSEETETIGFAGPVRAGFGGLETAPRGKGWRVTDRTLSLSWSAEVNLHYYQHRIYDPFDCFTDSVESDDLTTVEVGVEGRLKRNNRTGEFTVGEWGPLYISGFGVGEGRPPQDVDPTASGAITFDRDVRLAR